MIKHAAPKSGLSHMYTRRDGLWTVCTVCDKEEPGAAATGIGTAAPFGEGRLAVRRDRVACASTDGAAQVGFDAHPPSGVRYCQTRHVQGSTQRSLFERRRQERVVAAALEEGPGAICRIAEALQHSFLLLHNRG